MPLEIRNTDLFQSLPKDKFVFIPHVCNDIGGWGHGFVVSISNHWSTPEQNYREWYKNKYWHDDEGKRIDFQLGNCQRVRVNESVFVYNMIGQHDVRSKIYTKPIRYASLVKCMEYIKNELVEYPTFPFSLSDIEIHAPRFGSGLAGGNKDFIEELIKEIWVNNGIQTYIYDYVPPGM